MNFIVKKLAVLGIFTFALPVFSVRAATQQMTYVEKAPALQDFSGKNCWLESATMYKLDPYLLFAVAMVESGLNPTAVGSNTNGSYDYGFMQINSWWLPTLKKFGIEHAHLANPCVSIQVGAWILAWNFHRMGQTWEAIGAYNAKDRQKRAVYARKVYAMYDMLRLWGSAYQESYLKQYGVLPAFTPKPPAAWMRYWKAGLSRGVSTGGQQASSVQTVNNHEYAVKTDAPTVITSQNLGNSASGESNAQQGAASQNAQTTSVENRKNEKTGLTHWSQRVGVRPHDFAVAKR